MNLKRDVQIISKLFCPNKLENIETFENWGVKHLWEVQKSLKMKCLKEMSGGKKQTKLAGKNVVWTNKMKEENEI